MDIEKLKSIIRLANNNPNDNEANLAARKACKILAENDFALLRTRTAADKIFGTSSPTGRNTTWNDVRRSTEPAWGSYWANADKEAGRAAWDVETPFTGKSKKEPLVRKCTKCGVEVSTFRIKEEPFVCTVCHWKDV